MLHVFRTFSSSNISPPCEGYLDIDFGLPEYQVDVPTAVLSSSVVFVGLILCLCVFVVIIWFQELYEPRYIHQANVLLANFLSLLTFGLLFTGLMPTNYSTIKCSLVLTMVYFSLYLNLITEFIRILDCYIAIVFPFSHQQYITQENSLAMGACCWFIGLALSAGFYFTGLSRCTNGCQVTSLLFFQKKKYFQLGIAIPYLTLLLVAIYFSLHIIFVVLKKVRVTMSVGPVTASNDPDPHVVEEHDQGGQGAKLEHFLTVSKIVEQKEVFEKRFKYRKDAKRLSLTSYQESSFRSREVTETLRFSPTLSTVNYPPVMARKRNFHEVKDWEDFTTEQGGYRKETKTQTTHNIIQGPVVTSMIKASLKMIGISIILLITFLCLALPGLIFHHHVESDFPKYLFTWKLTMWVFLISRTLQPILILMSDKELKIKARQFIGAGEP